MQKTIICLFSAILLFSCGGGEEETTENDSGTSIVGNTNPDQSGTPNNPNAGGTNDVGDDLELTSLEYFDVKHDFGNVFYPSENKFTFKFKNTGNAPLVIEDAKASCGCTVPNKPEEPIMPGAIGELDVIFRPKSGQVGSQVTKKITVTANTKPEQTFLEITANVMDAM